MPQLRVDPGRSTLSMDGRSSLHPIRAHADEVVGWIDLDADGRPQAGHLTVEVDRLRTGNPLYDREIRNRLDIGTFPTVEAHLSTIDGGSSEDGWTVTGAVSAHGVQTDLTGTITVEPDGDGVRVRGREQVDFRQFGLKAPRLLALKVDPIVTVVLDVTATAPDQAP